MPIVVTDTDGGTGNILQAWDSVTETEFLQAHRDHFGQPAEKFRAYRYGLSDFSDVVSIDIPSECIHELSRMCMAAVPKASDPVVAIVGSQDHIFGLLTRLVNRNPFRRDGFRNVRQQFAGRPFSHRSNRP